MGAPRGDGSIGYADAYLPTLRELAEGAAAGAKGSILRRGSLYAAAGIANVNEMLSMNTRDMVSGGGAGDLSLAGIGAALAAEQEAAAAGLAELARGVMQEAAVLSVPLVVETGQGRSWGEAH